jgi:hypothetical protein
VKPKEELVYLLKHYCIGGYSTDIFVDEFYLIYNFYLDDSCLSQREADLFLELSETIDRFSPFEEELKIPNLYFSEKEVMKKSIEIYFKLTGSKNRIIYSKKFKI